MEDLYRYERDLNNRGINVIAGVDEVGRGPLIGSVITACVVLPKDFVLEGLTDSKKLSEKKRNMYYDPQGKRLRLTDEQFSQAAGGGPHQISGRHACGTVETV